MISKLLICSILVIQFSIINCQCPEKEFNQADLAYLKISIFGDPNAQFPENEKQFENRCNDLAQSRDFLKKFTSKCLNPLARTTFSLLLNGSIKQIKRYCSKKERSNFIKLNKCPAATQQDNRVCMNQFVKELKQIVNSKDVTFNTLICCSTYKFQECCRNNFNKNANCDQDAKRIFMEIVEGYTEYTRQIICPNVDPGSEKCRLTIPVMKKLPVSGIKGKSVLLPFLEISKNLSA